MERPSVSIVLTSHNYARYLPQAVDSALAQTISTEVVVVDDGSTDESPRILTGYGDRIHLILKENTGQASALNAGIRASNGRILLLLDADDWLVPEAASIATDIWREGILRVQFRLDAVDAAGRSLGMRHPPGRIPRGHDARSMILAEGRYPATGTTGVAYDRGALQRILPIPEDWWFAPGVYLQQLVPFLGRTVWLDRVVGALRIHDGNKVVQARPTPERLRAYLLHDERVEALMRAWAPELGIELPHDWAFRIHNHLRARIASLRWEPGQHPYANDRAFYLAMRGATAALRSARLDPAKRILLASWFLAVAAAPGTLIPHLVRFAFGIRRIPLMRKRAQAVPT